LKREVFERKLSNLISSYEKQNKDEVCVELAYDDEPSEMIHSWEGKKSGFVYRMSDAAMEEQRMTEDELAPIRGKILQFKG